MCIPTADLNAERVSFKLTLLEFSAEAKKNRPTAWILCQSLKRCGPEFEKN